MMTVERESLDLARDGAFDPDDTEHRRLRDDVAAELRLAGLDVDGDDLKPQR